MSDCRTISTLSPGCNGVSAQAARGTADVPPLWHGLTGARAVDLLRAHGFIRRAADRIKVLGDGELTTKLAIHAHAFSASAKEKITKAGGTFEVVA